MISQSCTCRMMGVVVIAPVLILSLASCAAVGTVATVANAAMEVTGIKKPAAPELPDAQKPPRTILINLQASESLNTDANGRSLALVARIYKLRQTANFQQASYDTFLNPQKEKEALGTDLLEVTEVTLVPGQKYKANEKVSREAYFVGVVALFRSPAPQRWRATFAAADAEKTGITVGMTACALTVGTGQTVRGDTDDVKTLSSVRCQ